jgi:hypothetical protein
MKGVTYRHNWSADLSQESEMQDKFGTLLVEHNKSEGYDVDESLLFQNKDGYFIWISASGCSCWDGEYDGWILNKDELKKMARRNINHECGEDNADSLVSQWILDNIK